MATKDLKLVHDIYKVKDEKNEKYFLNIKAIDEDGSEVILLDHHNNSGATGSKMLQSITGRNKNDFQQLVIEEYRAYTPGSAGATEPVQVHNVLLRSNKPARTENTEMFGMFGGFQGFVNFTADHSRTKGEIQGLQDRVIELKESKSQLIAKLGFHESENKRLELRIRELEDKIRDLKWKHDDISRDQRNKHDEELRKYKGQSAIIQAGVQGLGGLLMKKLNVSGEVLAGFLGMEVEPETHQSTTKQSMNNVEVETVGELTADQQAVKEKADKLYQWCLQTNPSIMGKVYEIFKLISSSEENLNSFYELAKGEGVSDEIYS